VRNAAATGRAALVDHTPHGRHAQVIIRKILSRKYSETKYETVVENVGHVLGRARSHAHARASTHATQHARARARVDDNTIIDAFATRFGRARALAPVDDSFAASTSATRTTSSGGLRGLVEGERRPRDFRGKSKNVPRAAPRR